MVVVGGAVAGEQGGLENMLRERMLALNCLDAEIVCSIGYWFTAPTFIRLLSSCFNVFACLDYHLLYFQNHKHVCNVLFSL